MSATLNLARHSSGWTPVGIRYCVTHCGTQNEDDWANDCDWRDRSDAEPCVFVDLAFEVIAADVAKMLAGLVVLFANEGAF